MTSNPTIDLGVSTNNGIPKSSILRVFSIINHPFWGTPIFGLRLQADRHAEFTRGQEVSKRLSVGGGWLFTRARFGEGCFLFKKEHGGFLGVVGKESEMNVIWKYWGGCQKLLMIGRVEK